MATAQISFPSEYASETKNFIFLYDQTMTYLTSINSAQSKTIINWFCPLCTIGNVPGCSQSKPHQCKRELKMFFLLSSVFVFFQMAKSHAEREGLNPMTSLRHLPGFLQKLFQCPFFVHLIDDVAPTHKLAVYVHLGERGPVRV